MAKVTAAVYVSDDAKVGAMVELTCETDFVGTNAKFRGFAADLAKVVAENNPADVDAFKACAMNGGTVESELTEMIHVIGENMKIARIARIATDGALASYTHHDGKHADIVEFAINNAETADNAEFKAFGHDVAMQVIASNPISASRDDIPEDVIEHEKSIYRAQAAESGRPEKFWDGIVMGRLKKFYQESTLSEQEFVKDPSVTISELAAKVSASTGDDIKIVRFVRFNFGE